MGTGQGREGELGALSFLFTAFPHNASRIIAKTQDPEDPTIATPATIFLVADNRGGGEWGTFEVVLLLGIV